VPYRESKITHLFRDALHGWGQILLSVNVSPVACDYDETSHVLKVRSAARRPLAAWKAPAWCGEARLLFTEKIRTSFAAPIP
jgi:hypothetical protein